MSDTPANKKWEEVQKKAFTHWVNTQLAKRDESIENLETGFVSGVHLISLVEILSGKSIDTKWTQKPKLKVHKITNCYIALQFLTEKCGVKGVTISAEDIVNGDRLTLILGFCWLLLRTFREPPSKAGSKGSSFEQNILQWCKDTLSGYSDINLDSGFKSESFRNGKAFLGLINEFDGKILKYGDYNANNKLHNVDEAFRLAEQHIRLPVLIDSQELVEGKTEDKNLVLYLSLFYNAFKERASGETRDSLLKRVKELEERCRQVAAENDTLRNSKQTLEHEQLSFTQQLTLVTTEKSHLKTSKEELESTFGSLNDSYHKETSELKKKISELEENIKLLQSSSADQTTHLQSAKDQMSKERDAMREELKKTKEGLLKEKENLKNRLEELLANLKKTAKAREELEELMKKKQADHSKTIHSLRKHLLQHVHDMHVWKVFLEQERDYESEDLHIIMEPELESFPYTDQINTLDTAISEENERLDRCLKERERDLAEAKKAAEAAHAALAEQEKKEKAEYEKKVAEARKAMEHKAAETKKPAARAAPVASKPVETKSDKKDTKKKDDKKKK